MSDTLMRDPEEELEAILGGGPKTHNAASADEPDDVLLALLAEDEHERLEDEALHDEMDDLDPSTDITSRQLQGRVVAENMVKAA